MAKKSFETWMRELEKVASELEDEQIGLDDAIAKYEKGVGAYKQCKKILEETEKRVEVLGQESAMLEGENEDPGRSSASE